MSKVAHRPRSRLTHALTLFRDYATHYDNKQRSAQRFKIESRSTAYRRMQLFLRHVPSPLPDTRPLLHTAVMLDGFYITYPSLKEHRHLRGAKTQKSVLLWAMDAHTFQPLHWIILRQLEDTAGWLRFFEEFTLLGFNPTYLVHDGHIGISLATKQYLPDAIHQRCVVHMVRNSHRKIGITPKAPLAQQLQSLIYQLPGIRSEEDGHRWLSAYDDYLKAFLTAEHNGMKQTKAFYSLHALLDNAHQKNELLTFLRYPELPNNTNPIESYNRVLREALQRHRGMPLEKRESLVAWLLLFRSTDNLTVIREHYERQRHHDA